MHFKYWSSVLTVVRVVVDLLNGDILVVLAKRRQHARLKDDQCILLTFRCPVGMRTQTHKPNVYSQQWQGGTRSQYYGGIYNLFK